MLRRCPLPFLSCMVDDCMKRGKSVQEGGAVYNFTGPQGLVLQTWQILCMRSVSLFMKKRKITMEEMKESSGMEL